MPTSSITKPFVIHDKKTARRLIKALEDGPSHKRPDTDYLEQGRKALGNLVFRVIVNESKPDVPPIGKEKLEEFKRAVEKYRYI